MLISILELDAHSLIRLRIFDICCVVFTTVFFEDYYNLFASTYHLYKIIVLLKSNYGFFLVTLFNFQGPVRFSCSGFSTFVSALSSGAFIIISQSLPFVNTFFELFQTFFKLFSNFFKLSYVLFPRRPFATALLLYLLSSPLSTVFDDKIFIVYYL